MFSTFEPFMLAALASTFSFVGARTQSSRRRTVRGRMTRPYCGGLYGPRRSSAILQMNWTFSAKFFTVSVSPLPVPNRPRTLYLSAASRRSHANDTFFCCASSSRVS